MGRDCEVKKNEWSKRMKPGFIQTTPIPTAETVVVDNSVSGFLYKVRQRGAGVPCDFYFVKLKPCLIKYEDTN
jgi:hypothetical protein